MHFVDEATIRVKAGDGGKGAIAFRREKFVPKGGPSGGDGGDGAVVVLVVDEGLSTLLDFRYRHEFQRARRATPGANKDRYGRARRGRRAARPARARRCSTTRPASSSAICARTASGCVVAQGGKGGRGNIHFATSTDRAPRKAEPGTPGRGAHGPPRAQAARRRRPARLPERRQVVADRPHLGGAPQDRRLPVHDAGPEPGHGRAVGRAVVRRRRHPGPDRGRARRRGPRRPVPAPPRADAPAGPPARRARAAEGGRPLRDYEAMNRELALYDPALAARPQLVVLNKIDLPDVRKRAKQIAAPVRARGASACTPSARRPARGRPSCSRSIWRALPPASARTCDLDGVAEPSTAAEGSTPRTGTRECAKTRKGEGIDRTCGS